MTFQTKAEKAQFSRPRWRRRDFPDQDGDGATNKNFLATDVDTARLSIPRRRRRDFSDRGGNGATKKQFFATVLDIARIDQSEWRRPRPKRKRRDFPDYGEDGATFQTEAEMAGPRTKNQFLATKADTARLSRLRRRLRNFSD